MRDTDCDVKDTCVDEDSEFKRERAFYTRQKSLELALERGGCDDMIIDRARRFFDFLTARDDAVSDLKAKVARVLQ